MSAYVVNRQHIQALVQAGMPQSWNTLSWYERGEDGSPLGERHELRSDTADRVGQMLTDECVRSVSYRYPDNEDMPGTYCLSDLGEQGDWVDAYRHDLWAATLSPVSILKMISCYEYQACEHPGWRSSEAFQFCEALRDWTICKLDGYDEAPWEYSPERVVS